MNVFGKRKGGGRRLAPRERSPLMAVVTTITGSQQAVVVDLSETGVRLFGDDLPRKGEPLELRVETIRAFGQVVWTGDLHCGVEFSDPLPTAYVGMLRQRVAALGDAAPQVRAALEDWTSGLAR